jgi:hypothetical protein
VGGRPTEGQGKPNLTFLLTCPSTPCPCHLTRLL